MSGLKDLKPCPICGNPAEPLRTRAGDDFVRCTNPDCHLRTRQYHENAVGPAEQWNTRAAESDLACENARLRELVRDMYLRGVHNVMDPDDFRMRIKRLGIEVR